MKVPYLEMLYAKVEISRSNSITVRENPGCLRLEYKQIRKIGKTKSFDYYNIRRLEIMKLQYLK